MIGFDKPVRPEWIHAVGLAWRPHQPVGELIRVVDQLTAPEFRGPETRSKVATIILRCFVGTEGGGPERRTGDRDLFAAGAQRFAPDELRPVYLAQLINATPALRTITKEMARRYEPGDDVTSTDFLHRIYEQCGQRGVVTNCVRHFLRTLFWFGCLERLAPNRYRYVNQLPIRQPTFPLLVWSWFRAHGIAQFELETLGAHPSLFFVQKGDLPVALQAFNGVFWSIEKRMGLERVVLRYSRAELFEAALLERFAAGDWARGQK